MDGSAPWRQSSTDWQAAGNLALGGAGSGLTFCAAFLSLATGHNVVPALLIGPLLAIAGLVVARADFGGTKQLLGAFFQPQTSWLNRQVLLAPLMLILAVVTCVFPMSLLLLLLAAVAGLGLYAQARTVQEADLAPAWRVKQVVPLIVCSGAADGAGLLAAVTVFMPNDAPAALRLAIMIAVLRWPVWSIYRDALGKEAPTNRSVQVALWTPCALLALAAMLPVFFGSIVAVIGGLATAAGGAWLRSFILSHAASPDQRVIAAGGGTPA